MSRTSRVARPAPADPLASGARPSNSSSEGAAPEAVVQPAIGLTDTELTPVLEGGGGISLARAKTHWYFGEWQALARLDLADVADHPDRDRFALLAASAHQQIGNHEEARRLTRLALEWGCPQRLVARVLIAGVHNTLGRAAALKQDDRRTARHFEAAVAVTDDGDVALAVHARSVREMARLGLLPQAASLLDKELHGADLPALRPRQQQARLDVLNTQVELLRGALILAEQRQQLFSRQPADPARTDNPVVTTELRELRKRAVSQLGQELWVLERTGYKRGGFFVDFGATDGVTLSNTWLLEKEFGWQGICAEPNPEFYLQLKRNRQCCVSDACIGARTGDEVEFLLADEYSGMRKHANLDQNAARRAGYLADPSCTIKLRTISLDDFLRRMGAPKRIDYLSIDTEGSELEILSPFPFADWQIEMLTVEHNFTPQREEIRRLLVSHGYAFVEANWDDWYYRTSTRT